MEDLATIPEAVVKYYTALGPENLGYLIGLRVINEPEDTRWRMDMGDLTPTQQDTVKQFLLKNGFGIKPAFIVDDEPISVWFIKK